VIVGGGSAGITVAARLRRAGVRGVAIVEPSQDHWYQPLWTLVGGGVVRREATRREEAAVIPRGCEWIRARAVAADPDARTLDLDDGRRLDWQWLVLAPGIQLDWDGIPGLPAAIGHDGVYSNYRADLAEAMWEGVRTLRGGVALFTAPDGPIKCGGAPQKIAYLASDWWRREGVLRDIEVHLALPGSSLFGIPSFARTLEGAVARYGIHLHLRTELVAIDGATRTARLRTAPDGASTDLRYDLAHVVPPQSAPAWLAASGLSEPGNPRRWVDVDRHTLRHARHARVFALGDCTNTPNAKTGAAVRKQAPVVARNLVRAMRGEAPEPDYDGYGSCPIVTSRGTCVLAEFDYDLNLVPSFPFIDMAKERRDMWMVKRWLLPMLYWRLMLKGLA
jgi:sulfide:quinone oxidoreductase